MSAALPAPFPPGRRVRLLRASPPHGGPRPVVRGTAGVVVAVRQMPGDDGPQALVKFDGRATPRHTPQFDLESE